MFLNKRFAKFAIVLIGNLSFLLLFLTLLVRTPPARATEPDDQNTPMAVLDLQEYGREVNRSRNRTQNKDIINQVKESQKICQEEAIEATKTEQSLSARENRLLYLASIRRIRFLVKCGMNCSRS